ncbi:hypothetical protein ACFYNX_26345 [Streptomyces sp. NPDC007872]|uniref:hypothetical protein n=1 Tax=Streptomyces sp. NPDC007872 TaxID=3364782 RepID=UPI0036BCE2FF
MTRPRTITALLASLGARLNAPEQTPAPTPAPAPVAVPAPAPVPAGAQDGFTVTAYVNVGPFPFFGYQSGDPVAEVTTTDNTPLRLTFTTDRVTDTDAAANAAFVVGNRQAYDDQGQDWPTDVRPLSVGDVLEVTAPDGTTTHLSVDSVGFSQIKPPTVRTALIGTPASSRTA